MSKTGRRHRDRGCRLALDARVSPRGVCILRGDVVREGRDAQRARSSGRHVMAERDSVHSDMNMDSLVACGPKRQETFKNGGDG